MDHFEVQFDHPPATFLPDQPVVGNLILSNSTPLKVQSVIVKLIGETKIENEKIDPPLELLFLEESIEPWKAEHGNTGTIPSGHHAFPFSFDLPSDSPPTFQNKIIGCIQYKIMAIILYFDQTQIEFVRFFTVLPHLDLNEKPKALVPVENVKVARFRRFLEEDKPLRAKAMIPHRGFSLGEIVPITTEIRNESDQTINQLTIRLIQTISFGNQKEEKELVEIRKYFDKTDKTFIFNLVIPKSVTPTFESILIRFDYKITILIGKSDFMKLELPIIVGTVPLGKAEIVSRTIASRPEPSCPPSYHEVVNGRDRPPAYYE